MLLRSIIEIYCYIGLINFIDLYLYQKINLNIRIRFRERDQSGQFERKSQS